MDIMKHTIEFLYESIQIYTTPFVHLIGYYLNEWCMYIPTCRFDQKLLKPICAGGQQPYVVTVAENLPSCVRVGVLCPGLTYIHCFSGIEWAYLLALNDYDIYVRDRRINYVPKCAWMLVDRTHQLLTGMIHYGVIYKSKIILYAMTELLVRDIANLIAQLHLECYRRSLY